MNGTRALILLLVALVAVPAGATFGKKLERQVRANRDGSPEQRLRRAIDSLLSPAFEITTIATSVLIGG